MTTAFVISGGGSLGAARVGVLEALAERGQTPDLLVSTSVGAINAAHMAGHGTSRGHSRPQRADPSPGSIHPCGTEGVVSVGLRAT